MRFLSAKIILISSALLQAASARPPKCELNTPPNPNVDKGRCIRQGGSPDLAKIKQINYDGEKECKNYVKGPCELCEKHWYAPCPPKTVLVRTLLHPFGCEVCMHVDTVGIPQCGPFRPGRDEKCWNNKDKKPWRAT